LCDELIGQVVAAVRPERSNGHGAAWEALQARHDRIEKWVGRGLSVVKIGDLLAREGVMVPQRTLHRYCTECTSYRGRRDTVPVADGEPGVECQIDFARMGMLCDSASGRRRVVHALIFTAVDSRHMFVWLTFSQTLEAIIAGGEAAWRFFGGVFKVLIPDNMSAIVAKADSVNPRFTVGWLEYAQARGFVTDPARVAHPQDKPRVERMVRYVRGNFFAGWPPPVWMSSPSSRCHPTTRSSGWTTWSSPRTSPGTPSTPCGAIWSRPSPIAADYATATS
jgi:hypothetical protein